MKNPVTGLTANDQARIEKVIAEHNDLIEATGHKLATDFNTPAQRTINAACAQMGIKRIDWEKIDAIRNQTEFVAPPKHILQRWESY